MITAGIVLELAVKSALVAGGVLLLLRAARTRSAAQRSWLAHLGLLGLVLLPAAVFLLPDWNPLPEEMSLAAEPPATRDGPVSFPALAEAGAAQATPPPGQTAAAAPAVSLPSAGDLAVWVYAIPALFLLLAMLIAVFRLGAMHRRANVLVAPAWLSALAQAQHRMGFKHGTALLVSNDLRSPVSWGLMRPIILLSNDTVDASDEAEAIIAHELAHVARLDWAKLLLSRLACALFWFNPLVWRLAREAHQLREEAADDAVLLSEVDDAAYATLLVRAARHDNKALLIAAHGVAPAKDSLKRRITRVLDRDTARGPAGTAWSALCVASLLAVAAPLAAFDPVAERVAARDERPGLTHTTTTTTETVATSAPDLAELAVAQAVAGAAVVDAPSPVADSAEHGRGNREIDDVVAYKAVDMSPDYISAMRAAGFGDADLEEMLAARAVGVSPDFARQVRSWDRSVSLEEVTEALAVGLTAASYGEMKTLFRDADVEEIVQLKSVGVTPAYAREMRALFPEADADDMTELKAVGVTPAFVREMRRQGMSTRDMDDVIEARAVSSSGKGPRGDKISLKDADGSYLRIDRDGIRMKSTTDGVSFSITNDGIAMAKPPAAPPAPPAAPAKAR